MLKSRLAIILFTMTLALDVTYAQAAGEVFVIPEPTIDEPAAHLTRETAVFAGGCFWGVQGVYQHVQGVTEALSGYTGGQAQTAHYAQVSEGDTGHAESVRITFNPNLVSYGQLLQIFFSVVHNPTELNHQGPDTGSQYRSTVFAQSPEQHRVAQAYISQLNASGVYPRTVATTVEDDKTFYPAEGYHQDYLTLHPDSPYIVFNNQPKVANLATIFPDHYQARPVLVQK